MVFIADNICLCNFVLLSAQWKLAEFVTCLLLKPISTKKKKNPCGRAISKGWEKN